MACFVVPAGEAIVTTVVQKVMEKRGKKTGALSQKWTQRLGWLNKMLWGGSILLAFEHVWHGEITFVPPFLTAMKDPADTAAMLHEMATFGIAMAVTITAVWGIMVLAAEMKSRTAAKAKAKAVPVTGGAG